MVPASLAQVLPQHELDHAFLLTVRSPFEAPILGRLSTAAMSTTHLLFSNNLRSKSPINQRRNHTLFLMRFLRHRLHQALPTSHKDFLSCPLRPPQTNQRCLNRQSISLNLFQLERPGHRFRPRRCMATTSSFRKNLSQPLLPTKQRSHCHKLSCRLACFQNATEIWICLAALAQCPTLLPKRPTPFSLAHQRLRLVSEKYLNHAMNSAVQQRLSTAGLLRCHQSPSARVRTSLARKHRILAAVAASPASTETTRSTRPYNLAKGNQATSFLPLPRRLPSACRVRNLRVAKATAYAAVCLAGGLLLAVTRLCPPSKQWIKTMTLNSWKCLIHPDSGERANGLLFVPINFPPQTLRRSHLHFSAVLHRLHKMHGARLQTLAD